MKKRASALAAEAAVVVYDPACRMLHDSKRAYRDHVRRTPAKYIDPKNRTVRPVHGAPWSGDGIRPQLLSTKEGRFTVEPIEEHREDREDSPRARR